MEKKENWGDDFSKDFFQRTWGDNGYYEKFSYGVGFEKVIQLSLLPFLSPDKVVLEVGSGGGVFTEVIQGKVKHLSAIDVIKKPIAFNSFSNFDYRELEDKDYLCTGVADNNFDFAYCYNVFCHLSNEALRDYINAGVHRVLKPGGDFIFMLANFEYTKMHIPYPPEYKREDNRLTPVGHFHQDMQTVDDIVDPNLWEVVNRDLVPNHRDIVIHLRKKGGVQVGDNSTGVIPNYSQNNEQAIIMDYFHPSKNGTFLDIGANDGKTLSNTYALLLSGWSGMSVEPSPKAFKKLMDNCQQYTMSGKLQVIKVAIGTENGMTKFHESGGFDGNTEEIALLSCIDPEEKKRWTGKVEFEEIEVPVITFDKLIHTFMPTACPEIDFINIDAEGMDYEILKQIDLNMIGCKCFCIEHNSIPEMMKNFREYAARFGFREIGFNMENLIFAK